MFNNKEERQVNPSQFHLILELIYSIFLQESFQSHLSLITK